MDEAGQDKPPYDAHVMRVVPARAKPYTAQAVKWDGSVEMGRQVAAWLQANSNARAHVAQDATGTWLRLRSTGVSTKVLPGEYVLIDEDGWAGRVTPDEYQAGYDEQSDAPTVWDVAGRIASDDPEVKSVIDLDLKHLGTLTEVIHAAVGAATMCWETVGGVFQDDKARDIACQLEHEIIRRQKENAGQSVVVADSRPPVDGGLFTDDQVHLGEDQTAWVKADAARRWVDLARAGEAKFREARERAQAYCREFVSLYGEAGTVRADKVLDLLQLDYPSQSQGSELGPGDTADPRPPSGRPAPTVGYDLARRRNLLISEDELPILLDLPPGTAVRSASVNADPLTMSLIVLNPDFDPVPDAAEAPIWRVNLSAFFASCLEGNRTGECVLENGHETAQPEEPNRAPQRLHIDRKGNTWGVFTGVDGG